MITIYGNPRSTCTRRVLMTLAENEVPYEMHVVDFAKGEHKQPEHVKRQPFGRIPALEDDGFEMFESRAMARYVDQKGGGRLTPSDPKARARMEQWISVETSEFSGHVMRFVYEHVFGRKQDPAVLEASGKALETTLGVMEQRLAQSPYLAGAELTLADVVFMPEYGYALGTPLKDVFAKYPAVTAWWNRVSERPTWRKVTGQG